MKTQNQTRTRWTLFLTRLMCWMVLTAGLPVTTWAQFSYVTNIDDTITITGYDTAAGLDVVIPDNINGYLVVSIGNNAFQYSSITNVTIPDSVTSIGDWAFDSCTSLTSVTIPNSVTSIGGGPFASCTSLTAITVDSLNSVYSSVEGVLFDKRQTALIQCPGAKAGSYPIPDSVTNIGNSAFSSCASLTNVTIPDSVTSIGSSAFSICANLTNVTIPNSVTSIGNGAFIGCWRLTSVMIPDSVTSIGMFTFNVCWSLTSVTIPDSVTSIGNSAFYYCSGLTNVTIGKSVTNIVGDAFNECFSLTSVFFRGNCPLLSVSFYYTPTILYYLPNTLGWSATVSGRPALLWNPTVQTSASDFGAHIGGFGLPITGTSNIPIVLEATTNLYNAPWTPLLSCTLTNGFVQFDDLQWTNHPTHYYRIRSP